MTTSIISLRIFEKEAITSYGFKIQKKEESTVEYKMDKIAEKYVNKTPFWHLA